MSRDADPHGRHDLCEATLSSLRAVEKALRYFHPLLIPDLNTRLAPFIQSLSETRKNFKIGMDSSLTLEQRSVLNEAAGLAQEALELFFEQDDLQQIVFNSLKAARKYSQAQELLFPLRRVMQPVHLSFLEEGSHAYFSRPEHACFFEHGDECFHVGLEDDPYARGTCSYYIPPGSPGDQGFPLVAVLHGGAGHGRDFLWFWLRESRSRGCVLMAPTSRFDTWSILRVKEELESIGEYIERVSTKVNIDREWMLLTGISDGATFSLACSLEAETPFAAFAPICGVLPPGDLEPAYGRRILWIHGMHDWMFPHQRAQEGAAMLRNAGADITLNILTDLAHAYPREQNASILEWFSPSLVLPRSE